MGTILAASVLGSLHCAGMCGPFVAVAATTPITVGGRETGARARGAWLESLVLSLIYSVGRLATYVVLGAMAGGVGSALNAGASLVGVQHAAAMLAGATMLVIGVSALATHFGVRTGTSKTPGIVKRAAGKAHAWASRFGSRPRAFLIGALTSLLPCGWLYAFLVTAAGMGDAGSGMMVMAAFWLGTVPILTVLGVGVHTALGPIRRISPVLISVLLMGLGVFMLMERAAPWGGEGDGSSPAKPPHCPLCVEPGN